MDAIYNFAKNFVNVKYEDIPSPAVEAAKKEFLDSLGVALAGSSKTGVKELVDLVKHWGGKQQSTIISYGIKVPAPNAAQVNATMTHALDYDDGHQGALVHTGAILIPTALAVAEQVGQASGREFITLVALGADFMCRLGLSTRPAGTVVSQGWHFTSIYGFLGAAAIAGRLLGLDEDRMVNALGIAYHQCSGNMQCVTDGALTKRMGPGFAVKGGITAALMAEKGITGAKNCLEGEFGIYKLYHQGDYDADALVKDLGRRFEGTHVALKPYPCCGITHVYIDAALGIVREHNIKPEDIKEIKVFGGEGGQTLSTPLEVKRNPRNAVDSQFSIPWVVAIAFTRGRPSVEHFTDTAIQSEDILKISNKINFELDHDLTRHGAAGPGIIKVLTKSGETYSQRVDNPLGSTERPLKFNDCVTKFLDCTSYAINPISKDKAERVVELIEHLDGLDDVTEIIQIVG
jgi:2-methylcitrate dehydratase PrpD